MRQYLSKLFDAYRNNDMQAEILHGIACDYVKDTRWQQYIIQCFSISKDELKEKISAIKQEYYEISGFSFDTAEKSAKAIRDFERYNRSWEFTVCKLSAFGWYKNIFIPSNAVVDIMVLLHIMEFCAGMPLSFGQSLPMGKEKILGLLFYSKMLIALLLMWHVMVSAQLPLKWPAILI